MATPRNTNTGDFDIAWTAQSVAANKDGYSTFPLNSKQPNQAKQVYSARDLPAGGLAPTQGVTSAYVHT